MVWTIVMMSRMSFNDCKQILCDFNRLCLCQNYTSQYIDVTCVNAPLDSIPNFDNYRHLYRIRLINVPNFIQFYPSDFQNLITLASLTITRSRLFYVNPDTFKETAIKHTLTSLDLSHGNLIEIPTRALVYLDQLQWLSLKGNQIEIIKEKELSELQSLRTLLLNENFLSIIEDKTFQKFINLESIDFSNNMIERVEGNPFPSTLKSLSFANCLLRKIPFRSIQNLNQLETLQLQNNLISQFSLFKLPVKKIQLIDLSHNLISHLPEELFTNLKNNENNFDNQSIINERNKSKCSLKIVKLYLDFNFIQSLSTKTFFDICIETLILSNNRISSSLISSDAFDGSLKKELKVLNLNYNLIDTFPEALKSLESLKQLLLKNNRLVSVDLDAFNKSANTLEILDLSQNLFKKIPNALNILKNLIKISFHDNLINKIEENNFSDWCFKLRSLTLSKNNLNYIEPQAFKSCNQLNELRLSGNKFLQIKISQFCPFSRNLQMLDLSSLNKVDFFEVQNNNNKNIHCHQTTFPSVKWLQFNFNSLHNIPKRLIELFPSIMHLDFQNNQIENVPLHLAINIPNLTSVIMSHNNISLIESHTFVNQTKLESITLYFNRIKEIKKYAFKNLPRLQSLVLSKNQINYIEKNSFYNLSSEYNSLTLMLDENRLECFSIEIFQYVSIKNLNDFSLYLNASHNQIKTFANCQSSDESKTNREQTKEPNQEGQTLRVRVLDLSNNKIARLTSEFMSEFCAETLSLFVNNNLIRLIPIHLFTLCPNLQTLSLNNNNITSLETKLESEDFLIKNEINQPLESQIQTLSLQWNSIKNLSEFGLIFDKLNSLKTLDLQGNKIKDIPENFFQQTKLMKLNLAQNRINFLIENDKCFGIEKTLKYLDVSNNFLTSLPNRLLFCNNLIELLVSNNQLYSLNLVSPLYKALIHLQRLDLNNNPIQLNKYQTGFQFFNNHSTLSTLNLNKLNIAQLEELNIRCLYSLDLSDNFIEYVNTKVFSKSRNIRFFNLAKNNFHEVPKHIWKYMTRLRHLNLRDNPIEILDSSSFAGLKYIRYLDIRNLKLQYIDSRIFIYQSQLLVLKTSTYPQIRSFRLQDILSKTDSLKRIEIDVKEPILSHQIQWAFGAKLRELIVSGNNLVEILPDAFQGLNNANDLILRITNTSIKNLPNGLLKYLADIRYITLDLKNNHLETVNPLVFFNINKKYSLKTWQSRQLLGGIILENNPLICDCNMLWISQWIKEVFSEMKSINVAAAIHAKSTLSPSLCRLSKNGLNGTFSEKKIFIIDLQEDDLLGTCDWTESSRTNLKLNHFIVISFLLTHIISL